MTIITIQTIVSLLLSAAIILLSLLNINNLMLLCCSKVRSRGGRPARRGDAGVREWPLVTIQVATYNEGDIVLRLLDSCLKIDYPPERFEVIVVDDSTDETISLLRDYERRYYPRIKVIHRSGRGGYKAGALNEALKHSRGEFILVLDADSVVEPDFLKKTIPELLSDGRLGFVQGRVGYLNRDYSWLTRTLALTNDWFATFTQKALSDCGMIMGFIGHGGVIRRRALEDIGGWMDDTMSEDMDMAYRLQLKGWRAKFIEDAVSLEEVPPSYHSAITRFKRHFKGTIQNLIKHRRAIFKQEHLSLMGKVEALVQLSYPLVYLLGLLFLALAAAAYISIPGALIDGFWLSWAGFLSSAALLLLFPYAALVLSLIPSIILMAAAASTAYVLSLSGLVKLDGVDLKGVFGAMLIWNDNIINFLTMVTGMIAGRSGMWVPTERVGRKKTSGEGCRGSARLAEAALRTIASLTLITAVLYIVASNFSLSSTGLFIPAVLWLCSAYLIMKD